MCWPSFHASTYWNKSQHVQLKMLKKLSSKGKHLIEVSSFFFFITKINYFKYLTTFLNDENEQSWFMESFSEACENTQICFRPGALSPLDPLPGLCPGPTGSLAASLTPGLICCFPKWLLFHFIMKTLHTMTEFFFFFFYFNISQFPSFSNRNCGVKGYWLIKRLYGVQVLPRMRPYTCTICTKK